ncbi:MAG: hypothetical protein ACPLRA_00505, partial [Candidatus Saccharicenans sp.]
MEKKEKIFSWKRSDKVQGNLINCRINNRKIFCLAGRIVALVISCWLWLMALFLPGRTDQIQISFSPDISRSWVGSYFYSFRLEDWRIHQGRIECLRPSANCYLYLLTREVEGNSGSLAIRFLVTIPELPERPRTRNFIGLRIGIKGKTGDYREAAVSGQGLEVGLATDGLLFIGELESVSSEEKLETLRRVLRKEAEFRLNLEAEGNEFNLRLAVAEPVSGKVLDELEEFHLPADRVSGGLALVSNLPEVKTSSENPVSFFKEFKAEGNLLKSFEERALGPVVFTLYTLSQKTLRLTAQLIPGSLTEETVVNLDIQQDGHWVEKAKSRLNLNSWTACFEIPDWNYQEDKEFRLRIVEPEPALEIARNYTGKIRKDPLEKDQIWLAVLSNNQEEGFPHLRLVSELKKHDPDLIFFGGNQIYGRPAAYWRQNLSLEQARQEYWRQWLLFGWEFSDLLKNRPAILIPEARDFFQLKLWGENGRSVVTETISDPIAAQDSGGFLMPQEFIQLVLETQTSHLPHLKDKPPAPASWESYCCEVRAGGL